MICNDSKNSLLQSFDEGLFQSRLRVCMSNDVSDDKVIDRAGSGATSAHGLKPSSKKPYRPPVLQSWGSFEDLTQANGNKGKSDGGHRPFSKTR